MKVLAVVVLAAAMTAAQDKRLSDLPRAVQAQTAAFGALAPARSGAPLAVTLPYILQIPPSVASGGYRVNATGSCTFVPAAAPAGGKTLSDSDVGIGIVATSPATGITIDPGLNYDPGAIKSNNGHAKYAGLAGGQATIADLRSGREVLRGGKAPSGNQLGISVRVATVPQFVTPGSFSCQILLTVM